jgi:hypothetical protein
MTLADRRSTVACFRVGYREAGKNGVNIFKEEKGGNFYAFFTPVSLLFTSFL